MFQMDQGALQPSEVQILCDWGRLGRVCSRADDAVAIR